MLAMRKLLVPVLLCIAGLQSPAASPTTVVHVHVVNDNGRPVGNAEVIVKFLEGRFLKPKKKESWELRTTQEGTATTPGIPQGKVLIQINAKNYQTFGETYELDADEKTFEIQLKPPQPQYTTDPTPPSGPPKK